MRKLFFFAVLLTSFVAIHAAPRIKPSLLSIDWATASSWDLGRVPQAGDTVEIPFGSVVIVNNNLNLSSSKLFVIVKGILFFNGGGAKLVLGPGSQIQVLRLGKISSTSSPSQIISIDGVTKYQGSGASIDGPMYADASTTTGFAPMAGSSLPVTFLGFNTLVQGADVLVQWSTAQELSVKQFVVERSLDGTNWNSIGTVAPSGSFTSVANYSFRDKNMTAAKAYYRIKEEDLDARATYTAVRVATRAAVTTALKTFANNGAVVLQFGTKPAGAVSVRIISLQGQVVMTQMLSGPEGQVVIPTALKGQHIVSVTDASGAQTNKQVVL